MNVHVKQEHRKQVCIIAKQKQLCEYVDYVYMIWLKKTNMKHSGAGRDRDTRSYVSFHTMFWLIPPFVKVFVQRAGLVILLSLKDSSSFVLRLQSVETRYLAHNPWWRSSWERVGTGRQGYRDKTNACPAV
jgi:hypothetical protein